MTYYHYRIFTGFQRNIVRKWEHFFKDTDILLKKYRDNIGYVKERKNN